jgi:two-component system, NarL family, response regulator LiaR
LPLLLLTRFYHGLGNRLIVIPLLMSDKTVKGHVGNILSRLQLADRRQAAVLAWRAKASGRANSVSALR